jgi:hypothetical protein
MRKAKHSKCVICGKWRPIGELKLSAVTTPLMSRQELWRKYVCAEKHTEKQMRAYRRRWPSLLIERWG